MPANILREKNILGVDFGRNPAGRFLT